jgi:hypothetical protein
MPDTLGYFGRIWTWASSICVTWPGVDTDQYTGPFTANTANPVLIVGNTYDPSHKIRRSGHRRRSAAELPGCSPRARLGPRLIYLFTVCQQRRANNDHLPLARPTVSGQGSGSGSAEVSA